MSKPVAILAGGKGTRLGYAGQKCMAPVAGRPFLDWKLDQLVGHGATELHLLVAWGQREIRDYFGDNFLGIPITYHIDAGTDPYRAHREADLPFFHWLTYGDCMLDAPLRVGLMPYVYINEEFPDDAGLMWCWGKNFRWFRWPTNAQSFHLNTPADLQRTEDAIVHRLSQSR